MLAYSPTRQPRDQRVSQDQIFWELPALWEGFWVWSGTTGKTETTAGHKKKGCNGSAWLLQQFPGRECSWFKIPTLGTIW